MTQKAVEGSAQGERKATWREALENAAQFSGEITSGWRRSCHITRGGGMRTGVITEALVN